MTPGVLTLEDLRAATGYSRQADIARCLERQGVRFFYGRAGIWTTIDALNAALGVRPASNDGAYDPDEVI